MARYASLAAVALAACALVRCDDGPTASSDSTSDATAATSATAASTVDPGQAAKRKASICADLDPWITRLQKDADEVAKVLSRIRERNKKSKSPIEILQTLSEFKKASAAKAEAIKKTHGELQQHGTLSNEEKTVLADVARGFETVAVAHEQYAEHFAKGAEGLTNVVMMSGLAETMPSVIRALHQDLAKRCKVEPTAIAFASPIRTRAKDGAIMVKVPAGSFIRGSKPDEGEDDEHPQKTITVKEFWIDRDEVTAARYQTCVDDGGCKAPQFGKNNTYGVEGKEQHPVNFVAWQDAVDYCTWAGARLPTEAQWEKAARGTDGRDYPWGAALPTCLMTVMPESSKRGCGSSSTWPVGSRPAGASPYGAYDMSGNVWEWCADYYAEAYYETAPDTDPTGPTSGSPRVLRGGAWEVHDNLHLRPANRYKFAPTFRFHALGFRCAGD